WEGTIWAATFGGGVIAVPPVGVPRYFNSSNSPLNDNVLSVEVRDDEVWFATLEGLTHYDPDYGFVQHPLPFPGFVFDVLPMENGTTLAATDGNGVIGLETDGQNWNMMNGGEGTYYSLVTDMTGTAWAAGPGTGFCKIVQSGNECRQASRSPFDGDLFALASYKEYLIAFGSTGTRAFEPATGSTTDVTAKFGAAGIQAELNAVAKDNEGSLWLATDRGLVRMRPTQWHFSDHVHTAIRAIRSGAEDLDQRSDIVLPYDHERIAIQFSGIHWVDPGGVRFQYRLLGADERGQVTRDREVVYSNLAPGDYTFQVRAFTGNAPSHDDWVSVRFSITSPFWQRPWVIAFALLFLSAMLFLIMRTRERRGHERERMEQEKVRFQLEALRSQVDPHFLFNSFNTLVELIETVPERAVEHVEKLSLFFRNILLVRDKELITVEEELRLLKNYFALEQHRFGKAIQLQITVGEEHWRSNIVPLTLQMLAENALKHNVATLQDPLLIEVTSSETELIITNKIHPRLSAPRSTAFGLDSIRKRYQALTVRPIRIDRTHDRFTVGIPLIGS
nr:histidine kinase [Bacteroidota bacterium]